MQAFLPPTSSTRSASSRYIKKALDDDGIAGQTIATQPIPADRRLARPDDRWPARSARTAAGAQHGPPAPGPHGHGSDPSSSAARTLDAEPRPTASRRPNPTFTVNFENQGENDETNVMVKVAITGAGTPVHGSKTVAQTDRRQRRQRRDSAAPGAAARRSR